MIQRLKTQYIILAAVCFLIVIGLLLLSDMPISKQGTSINLPVYVADSPAERTKGLSGRDKLPKNRGMLFVFDNDGKHSIWMKDMKFNIDAVWLDKNKYVVDVNKNLMPSSYPKNYSPKKNARYILELPSGQVDARNIAIGTQLSFTTVVD
jgi:uncharacterized membrane protein (UPF0127 family)